MLNIEELEEIENQWREERWKGIVRPYNPEDVLKLRGSLKIEYTVSKVCSIKLWRYLTSMPYVTALGALTGSQAVQMAEAGLKAIYVSGWQVAADNNESGNMYPDLGLYPSNSAPILIRKIVKALQRRDQIQMLEGRNAIDYYIPIVADGEAGFGGPLHAFELMKAMIEAGAAGVHFEDQSTSERRCGHLGGKVLVPTSRFIRMLIAARLAADVCGVPSIIIARTDAIGAQFITSDIDERDAKFITGTSRTEEGFYEVEGGLEMAIERALAYAPYSDMLWFETSKPDLEEARKFADAIHSKFPGKILMYNLSPSFNWLKNLDADTIATFQNKLGEMGYKFQFITLAGFHSLNASMFELAKAILKEGMLAYAKFQQKEFELEKEGFRAVKHQSYVGVNYYDEVSDVIHEKKSVLKALTKSTEKHQF
ncbi:MAG TPA: isocitrate lyase [Geobacterales bacterium]|nr:isocitrate lyase [Geobacterales bacterium]